MGMHNGNVRVDEEVFGVGGGEKACLLENTSDSYEHAEEAA